jgi:TPR repeat protein
MMIPTHSTAAPMKRIASTILLSLLCISVSFAAPAAKSPNATKSGEVKASGKSEMPEFADRRSRNQLVAQANTGDLSAMNVLGWRFFYAAKAPYDIRQAVQLWAEAAKRGNARAMARLGRCYLDGKGLVKNDTKAFELFSKAAKQNDRLAIAWLIQCYAEGRGTKQDVESARNWIKHAEATGAILAMLVSVGSRYESIGFNPADVQESAKPPPASTSFKFTNDAVFTDAKEIAAWVSKAIKLANDDKQVFDPQVDNTIALIYLLGVGGQKQDRDLAMKWFQKAMDKGSRAAIFYLGQCHSNSWGVEQNYVKAASLYQQAAGKGDGPSMSMLGRMYLLGHGVNRDFSKAMIWFTNAVTRGRLADANSIGFLYSRGLGVQKDDAKAVHWYRQAAEFGDQVAMDNLGMMYMRGTGVDRDFAESKKWFEKAHEKGRNSGTNNLAVLYFNGWGVDKDYPKAHELFQMAAKKGYARAISNIGKMYLTGKGVKRDHDQALLWLRSAIDAGDAQMAFELARDYSDDKPSLKQDLAKATKYYTEAAAMGHADGMFSLGVFYMEGVGVKQDKTKGLEWIKKSAAAGSQVAKVYLKSQP